MSTELDESRPNRRGHNRPAYALLLLAAGLAGCAILPQRPSAIYDLTAPTQIPRSGGTGAQILVPEPSALRALDTDRIAARPSPAQYAYLPGAVWSDLLPKLLQARLMESFQNSGRIRAASIPGQGLLIDYQVVLDVRAFEFTGEGAAAEFSVKLMDDKAGRIVATRVIREVVPLASMDTPTIVAGLDAAMDAAFAEIVSWTLNRI